VKRGGVQKEKAVEVESCEKQTQHGGARRKGLRSEKKKRGQGEAREFPGANIKQIEKPSEEGPENNKQRENFHKKSRTGKKSCNEP